jgi:uncharacterized protein (UPF0332 family)
VTEEQFELIRQAKADIQSAQNDLETGNLRAAISRTYYAMFYIARVFLLEKNLTFSKHSATISAFGQHFAATGNIPSRFHRMLSDAFELRGDADYDFETPVDREETEKMIRKAQEFMELAEQHFGPIGEHEPTDVT